MSDISIESQSYNNGSDHCRICDSPIDPGTWLCPACRQLHRANPLPPSGDPRRAMMADLLIGVHRLGQCTITGSMMIAKQIRNARVSGPRRFQMFSMVVLNTRILRVTRPTSKCFDYAKLYQTGGVSIIPILCNGSKAAALKSWNPYRERIATDTELNEWFVRGCHGIGIVCGPISGGLEVIDFDTAELWRPWKSLLPHDLQCRLTTVQTPGGWHVMYRCREYCGSRKLAMWEDPQSISERDHQTRQGMNGEPIGKGVRIETRGDGGYIVGCGSPHSVHSSRLPYSHFGGREPWRVMEVSPDERRLMWQAAMTFDCSTSRTSEAIKQARRKLYQQRHGSKPRNDSEPWRWFDHNGPPIIDMLEGWQIHRELTDGYTVTRPGKTFGVSGKVTINDQGEEILTVYSSSAGPLAPINGKAYASYGRFNLLAITRFRGDRKEAAKYVRQLMQGARSK